MKALALVVLSIQVCLFAGCGSSGTSIALSSPSGQTLKPGQSVTITAVVSNDKNNQGVAWALSGAGGLTGNTPTSVVYTAPLDVEAALTATITATSVANTTVTATETLTVNAVLSIITTSLPAGIQGVPYDAFISAAGAPPPFTWSLISGSPPPGLTFSASSSSNSGEITGTPTVLGTSSFTVQVTDSASATVTQALSITINPSPPLSVATQFLPAGTVGIEYSQPLMASSGVPPYTWNIASGALPFGLSLASNGLISGTPVASGTFQFTVHVVDSTTPTHQEATSGNLSITIGAGNTNNARLSGFYGFSVSGSDANGFFTAAGRLFADGDGKISSGILDTNDTGTPQLDQSFTGTYSIGENGLGSMTINLTAGGSRTFVFSMMANDDQANLIEFDDSTGGGTRNSGVLLKQMTTSALSTVGSYAFGFLGIDSSQNRFGMAGEFQVDGAGKITGGLLDTDDGVLGASPSQAITMGSYSIDSNTGRGLASFTSSVGTFSFSFYVVNNANELLVIEIDPFVPGGADPLVSGLILQQSGGFNNTSLSSPSVFEVTALKSGIPEDQVGLFSGNGAGVLTLTSDQNYGGTLMTLVNGAGSSYTVASTGRVTLSNSGFQNNLDPVLYLVNNNEAFIIGTDLPVSFGFMTPQSVQQFSSASLSGIYAGGSTAPPDTTVPNVVSIAVAGSNNFNVTANTSGNNGLSQNQASEIINSVASNGRVVVTENGNAAAYLYLVSPAQFFSLEVGMGASPRVDIFGQ